MITKAKQLYLELDKANNHIEKVEVLDRLAFYYLNADPARCQSVIDEILAISTPIDYKVGLSTAYNSMARLSVRSRQEETAIKQFIQALRYLHDTENLILKAKIFDGLAIAYANIGCYDLSIDNAQKAYNAYEEALEPTGLKVNCLNNIGNAYFRMGDLEKAELVYKQALDINENKYNGRLATNVRGNMAGLMLLRGDYQDAIDLFETCMVVFEELDHKHAMADTNVNLGKAYMGLNKYADAVLYYQKAIGILRSLPLSKTLADAYLGLAHVYHEFNGRNEALHQIEQAELVYTQLKDKTGEKELLKFKAELIDALNGVKYQG